MRVLAGKQRLLSKDNLRQNKARAFPRHPKKILRKNGRLDNMAAMKIVAIGANAANAEEIKRVVIAAIGGDAVITTATLKNYKEVSGADLYVCLINRKREFAAIFGAAKVIDLTLVPPTEFFLEVSRIPAGSGVIIFNNSVSGTVVLTELLKQYNLLHFRYEVVPYDEWDYRRVAEKLAAAQYIIGGIAYVSEDSVLRTKFGACIPRDAIVIVSPPRIATSESLSRLSNVYSSMYHKRIMAELKRLSSLDYLTEIPNRRTFDKVLGREWGRAQREEHSLTLAMIDIDLFKNYNDVYGHIAGDECLKVIARTLKSVMRRPADFCARYGGEEFAVILPNTNLAGARHLLEDFRTAITAFTIKQDGLPNIPGVTVSIGIAEKGPLESIGAEELLQRADKALYNAKRQGRNRVVPFSEQDNQYTRL